MKNKLKKLLALVLLVCMAAFTLSITACGKQEADEDTGGLVLTISNDKQFYVVTGTINFTGSELSIPAQYEGLPVKAINQKAFKNCTTLTSVNIPDSITNIGKGAFTGCTGLREISVPFMGESVGATRAKSVFGYIFGSSSYPNSVPTDQVYNEDEDYSTYYIPTSLEKVVFRGEKLNYGSFYGMTGLRSVVLGERVNEIEANVFAGCSSFSDLYVCSPAIAKGITGLSSYGGLAGNCDNLYVSENVVASERSDFLNAMAITERGLVDGIKYDVLDYESAFEISTFEAENARLDGALVNDSDISSGNKYVGFGNGGSGKSVTFGLTVSSDATAMLLIRLGGHPNGYIMFSELMELYVNGERVTVPDFAVAPCDTVTWANWQEYALSAIDLKADTVNTITFRTCAIDGIASNFDCIYLKSVKGTEIKTAEVSA